MGYIRDLSIQFLMGCTLQTWIKLLWQNKDKPIYWRSLPKFLYITFVIILLTPIRLVERIFFNIRVKKTKLEKDPVFVLGHWRSGTTYLVNMLSQDEQFAVTNAIHCFCPNMFLSCYSILEFIMKKFFLKTVIWIMLFLTQFHLKKKSLLWQICPQFQHIIFAVSLGIKRNIKNMHIFIMFRPKSWQNGRTNIFLY